MGLVLALLVSCNNSNSPETVISEDYVEPGFKLDPNRKDPNERIFIPEEWNPELIYNSWKISSIKTRDEMQLIGCDETREIAFTKTKNGSQSGISHFAMEISQNDENCPAISRKTVWYFNPYTEREAVLINLPLAGQFVSGSFKVIGLNSESMTLIKDFYQIQFSRIKP